MEQFRGTKIRKDLLITGEAVALDLRPATIGVRAISGLIDVVAIASSFIICTILLFVLIDPSGTIAGITALVSTAAICLMIVPISVETLTRGYSLGKYVVGTRVVRDDGGPLALRHAIIRNLVGLAEVWLSLCMVALIVGLINPKGKRVGDYLAGTYVISIPARPSRAPLVLPPEMAYYAAKMQVRELPDALVVSVRSFLSGASSMLPEARTNLGRSLASQVETFVTPPPPWGVDPERFLATVLVVRRDFEYDNLLKRQAMQKDKVMRATRAPFSIGQYLN